MGYYLRCSSGTTKQWLCTKCLTMMHHEVRPDRMSPTAPPCRGTFLALHTLHLCMFLGFLCGQEGEISLKIQVVALCACVSANFFFHDSPCICTRHGVCRTTAPLSCATCLTTAACLEACLHPLSTDSPLS